jgi:hypothetical protein
MADNLLRKLVFSSEDMTTAGVYDLLRQAQMFEYLRDKHTRKLGLLRYCKDSLTREELDRRLDSCNIPLEDCSLTWLAKKLMGIDFLMKWRYSKSKNILVSFTYYSTVEDAINTLSVYRQELKLANKNVLLHHSISDLNHLDVSIRAALKSKGRGPFRIDDTHRLWKHKKGKELMFKQLCLNSSN